MLVKRLATLFVLCLMVFCTSNSFSGKADVAVEAPFGLSWGASQNEIKRLGANLTQQTENDYGVSLQASGLSRVLADVEGVQLSFGYDDKLWRIVAISKSFRSDPYGSAVVNRYNTLVQSLSKKYGKGNESHHRDSELWNDADEFLMGIRQGRSWHFTSFETDDLSIEISVRASSGDEGFYALIYTNKRLEIAFEKQKSAKEEGSL